MVDHESRSEAAYAPMYDAAPHNVKDCYEDACLCLAHAIQIAAGLALTGEVEQLKNRGEETLRLARTLPEDAQDRVAQIILAFAHGIDEQESPRNKLLQPAKRNLNV